MVVLVHNEESDRTHTVVPDAGHCSCEDHTYRDTVCKHLLFLLQQAGHIGHTTRESIKEQRHTLEQRSVELRAAIDTIENKIEQITTALDAVDADQDMERTGEEVVEAIQADLDEDDADEFAQFVDDMVGGGR
jgi:hypothetical protein